MKGFRRSRYPTPLPLCADRAGVQPAPAPGFTHAGDLLTPPKSASLLVTCALARPAAGGCAWCGTALPARRRTWCGDRCGTAFWTNHWWTLARAAAKRRDKYRCRTCGAAAPKRPSRTGFATVTAYRAAMRGWRAAKKTQRMEVNHRVPCRGKHGTVSCDHHLDNLETLCMTCHAGVTRVDRKSRTPQLVASEC